MSQPGDMFEQESFIGDEAPDAQSREGPAALPPAPLSMSTRGEERDSRAAPSPAAQGGTQLSLPLEEQKETRTPTPKRSKRTRKGRKGFVPVTRDPEVARSYSDNVALDYAIARGLAQVLSDLPPEELAALRAKVAQASRRNGKGAAHSSH